MASGARAHLIRCAAEHARSKQGTVVTGILYETQSLVRYVFFASKSICLLSDSNTKRLNQNDSKQQIAEKMDTWFPRQCSTNNTVIIWMMMLTITFPFITKGYWAAYASQANSKYAFSSEYHNLRISIFISICSWYHFYTNILKHIYLSNIQLHSLNEYLLRIQHRRYIVWDTEKASLNKLQTNNMH
jgi:hypothetical protein